MNTRLRILVSLLLACTALAEESFKLDMKRAQELYGRDQRGEKLSDEDRAWLKKAKGAVRRQSEPPKPEPWTILLTPLTEFGTGTYKG